MCYGAQVKNPVLLTTPLQKAPLVHIILLLIMSHAQIFLHFSSKYLAAITKSVEPKFYSKAGKDPQWQKAMIEEIHALENNITWEIVDLPPSKEAHSLQMGYRVKYNLDSSYQ